MTDTSLSFLLKPKQRILKYYMHVIFLITVETDKFPLLAFPCGLITGATTNNHTGPNTSLCIYSFNNGDGTADITGARLPGRVCAWWQTKQKKWEWGLSGTNVNVKMVSLFDSYYIVQSIFTSFWYFKGLQLTHHPCSNQNKEFWNSTQLQWTTFPPPRISKWYYRWRHYQQNRPKHEFTHYLV